MAPRSSNRGRNARGGDSEVNEGVCEERVKELVREAIQELLQERARETEALRAEVEKLRDDLLEKGRDGAPREEERAEIEEACKRQLKEWGGFENVKSLMESQIAQDAVDRYVNKIA